VKSKRAWIVLIILSIAIGALMRRDPVTISLERSENAPLSALAVVDSREPVRITIRIPGKNNDDLIVSFEDFSSHHELPLLGLYADWNNEVEFTLITKAGEQYQRVVNIQTEKLPSNFPEIEVQRLLPDRIAPGMTFLQLGHYNEDGDYTALPCAIDNYGNARWFYRGDNGHVLTQLDNGNMLIQDGNTLLEIDMLGNTIATRAEQSTGIHHDMTFTGNGNMLILSSAPSSFEDGVVELDWETGQFLLGWDLRTILDHTRPPQPVNLEPLDWLHLNGIDYREHDDSFIVSGRDQSAVVCIQRETGQLLWILGNHEHWETPYSDYLLDPIGQKFEWQWGQHAPMVNPKDPDRILVYDNGNERSYDDPVPPMENYSRAVEYEIDEERMEVRQIWEYGTKLGSETFTPFIGDANYLPNGNRLVCFGGITRNLAGEPVEIFDFEEHTVRRMKISARIVEVTDDIPAQEVLRLSISNPETSSYEGYRSYRAERYPLYHPALLD
jgi:arylsulfate sulfotransferase